MDLHTLRRYAAVLALSAVLPLAACGGQSGGESDEPTAAVTDASPEQPVEEPYAEPEPEGTETEEPQEPVDDGGTLPVPTLPVGGDVYWDGVEHCAEAFWLGPDLPEGVEITVDSVGFAPGGVFELGGEECAPDVPRCADGWTWTPDTASELCVVPALQVVEVEVDTDVDLVLGSTVVCATEAACDELAAADDGSLFGGTQITLYAEAGPLPTNG